MADETVLDVRHLSKTFPVSRNIGQVIRREPQQYVRAVEDVSFTIHRGETLGLVGESGCGKSTLSRTIMRLYKPDEGMILFSDYGNLALAQGRQLRKARQRIQMVFQDPYSSLNPKMTVRQMFYEEMSVHHLCTRSEFENRAKEIMSLVGMPADALDRYPSAFSGGQRQRLCIARALIMKPELLIADEPVSALDMSIQAQIINLLDRLRRDMNLTMIFISHGLRVVQYISDHVMVMYLGRIVEMGTTQEIFEHPAHPYTRILTLAAPEIGASHLDEDKPLIRGETPSPIQLPSGCPFHPRCPWAQDICRSVDPELRESPSGHAVRCHYPLAKDVEFVAKDPLDKPLPQN